MILKYKHLVYSPYFAREAMDWILNCNRYIDMGKSLVTGRDGGGGGLQTHCTSLFRFEFPPPFRLNMFHDAWGVGKIRIIYDTSVR